jgi:mannose-6-phosphate isomerase-like protein (cupin superfamily)
MVAGRAAGEENRIVAPPGGAAAPHDSNVPDRIAPLRCRLEPLNLPLEEDRAAGWKPFPIFRGATRSLDFVSCHASVLSPGVSPHDLHAHIEEEILIVLAGEVDLVMLDEDGSASRHCAVRGTCAYYPAFHPHTIENRSERLATYVMFKWSASEDASATAALTQRLCSMKDVPGAAVDRPLAWTLLFEGPTRHLQKLHCHVTTLQPGGGYDAHADAYDVAILAFEGEVETGGRRIGPNSVAFFAAGQPHDMRNVGRRPARYFVFELHGNGNMSID